MADKLRKTKYKIIDVDPYLQPFYYDVDLRMKTLLETQQRILKGSEELTAYANGYLYFGFHRTAAGWVFREWAPAADAVHLIGDFNNWDRGSHPLNRLENGIWEIEVPGQDSLSHLQLVKLQITFGDKCFDRIPSYIRRAVYEKETNQLIGQIWDPPRPFAWTDGGYGKEKSPLCVYMKRISGYLPKTRPSVHTAVLQMHCFRVSNSWVIILSCSCLLLSIHTTLHSVFRSRIIIQYAAGTGLRTTLSISLIKPMIWECMC